MSKPEISLPDRSVAGGTTRRSFLTWSALVGAAAFTPAMLSGPDAAAAPATGSLGSAGSLGGGDPFALGVASGDPLPDSVILWTRVTTDPLVPGGGVPPVPVPVDWEVARDERFRDVVARGSDVALPAAAHSVHVDVRGLEPWRRYFYRFRALGQVSPVGRTRTAPAAGADVGAMAFAWASCQAWYQGYYTAYADMAEQDLDVVFHLGDYIYEYDLPEDSVRPLTGLSADVRRETTTLQDYRLRYGLFKSDAHLQSAHRAAAWIHTIDDHEVDNNWASQISQDEGADPRAFLERRAQAFRAWWEHTPTRVLPPSGPDMRLYRRYDYGNLASFSVLDTRQYRSDQAHGDGQHVQDKVTADAGRTITGGEQEQWILDGFDRSEARWNFLAHQTVITDLPRIRDGERKVSMDQWGGYEASRHRILDGARDRGVRNLVSMVGDIHRTTVSELRRDYRDDTAPAVGVEMAGTSIASGKDGEDSDKANEEFLANNPAMKFGSAQRGYVLCELRPDRWQARLKVTDKVTVPGRPVRTRATITVPDGKPEIDVRA
ncbi:alkaline phosphatase D family protein [Tomitella gaofuii]|uniref:alkaline phosphatase D family protein n=1 Tax=Tomitella gaofuii TaxID=2760083 RepID=UPI0015F8CCFC|nr:alkaline phosphatase D family protein [Tomitella gaofuii]